MKMVFRILLISVIISGMLSVSYAQDTNWVKLDSPVNSHLRNLFFVDSLTGWAAGASGIIIHTTDGGATWSIQNSNVTSFITDIFFLDKNFGRAITVRDQFPFNTVILKTTNGGNEWASEDFPDMNAFLTTIFFHDSLNGFAGGSYIAKTTDGGNTWVEADVDSGMLSTLPVYKFRFFNKDFGYACGGDTDIAGVIWKTTNGGLNWSSTGISPDEIFDLFIIDSLNAISLSGDPKEFYTTGNIKTTDAGENWIYEELPFYSLSFAIDLRTANEGWSASGYRFLWTTDTGLTWNQQATPESSVIYDVQFTDIRTGYAVGEEGTILKFIPPPLNIDDEISDLPSEFILYQNYPNPFNPTTRISWQSSVGSWQTLKVYDILGREVATLVNEERQAGVYEIEFQSSVGSLQLASGVYYYQLKAGDFAETKKMILLK